MQENKKVIVLVGPSNSGKSTWAKKFIRAHPNYIRINRDSFRYMLQFVEYMNKDGERLIDKIMNNTAIEALTSGYNIILDSCNCNLHSIKEVIRDFHELADIEFQVFEELSVAELVERSTKQAIFPGLPIVPEWIIARMVKQFRELKTVFNFEPIKKKQT